MKKIGIFVEGQSERIFVLKFLIEYLGGEHNFSRREIKWQNKNRIELITSRDYPLAKIYFLIFDCAGDGNVLPALYERSENMIINENFSFIIALQDLYDKPLDKKELIIDYFKKRIEDFSYKAKLKFVLAVMELEAWFLTDPDVFSKISSKLTPKYLQDLIKINLFEINPETLPHPSATINKIYNSLNRSYSKSEDEAYEIIHKLDFDIICSDETLIKVKSLKYFIDKIDESLEV